MNMDSPEISNKIKSAIKAKLVELESYVDDELPDYIMVMVANKKTQKQMENDLEIFLHTQTPAFTKWLFTVLEKLEKITKEKKSTDKTGKKDKKKKTKKSADSKEEKSGKKEVALDADGNPVPNKKKTISVDKPKKEKKKNLKPKEPVTTAPPTEAGSKASSALTTSHAASDKKLDPTKPKSSKTEKSDKTKRSKSPKNVEPLKKKAQVVQAVEKIEEVKTNSNEEVRDHRSSSKEVRKRRRGSSARSRSSSRSSGDRRRFRRSPETQREQRRGSSPVRGRSRPDRSRSPVRAQYRGPPAPGQRSPDRRGFHNQRPKSPPRPNVDIRRREFEARSGDRSPDPRRRDDRLESENRREWRHDERRHSYDGGRQQHHDDRRQSRESPQQRRHQDERNRHPRDDQRNSRTAMRRSSRSASPEQKGDKMMSSVVAVVKKVRRNDEDNDEYNPMKMLKTSIASKVQVPRPKSSTSRSDKPVNPASKVLVTRAFQEADSSIKRKKQEELEREAQLEDLRRRREEKLSKLRSKGIGIKTNQRNSNEGPRPEVRVKGSDVIRSTGNEKYHRHSPDDLDDDLEMEELRSTTNKKNFVIEIKNRVEPSSEDLRVRLDKRRLVVRSNDVNKNEGGHRNIHDIKQHDEHRGRVHRSSPKDESREPPKIVVEDKKKITDEDKDLMEMRRRALESLARGRAQQQQEHKKVIVPLNEDSSSSSVSDSESSDSSSSDSSSNDEISLTSTENEKEEKRPASKEEPTFVVTLEGIDASYFRNKARPSQTNSLLKKNKKEDEHDSGKLQDQGFEGPIVVEQRDNISVPVLAAVGGGSGRSDPKIDDSVYRTSKKPEAKVRPTVKAEKSDQHSPKKSPQKTESHKKDISMGGGSSGPPKKIRKRIEAPAPEKEPPAHRPPTSRVPVLTRPISRSSDNGNPAYLSSRPVKCKFWPNCVRGSQCNFYHPSPTSSTSSSSVPDKYRWSSANAPV